MGMGTTVLPQYEVKFMTDTAAIVEMGIAFTVVPWEW